MFPLGRRIPIALPNTGALARKRNSFYLRAIVVICLVLFAVLQLHLINSRKYHRVQSIHVMHIKETHKMLLNMTVCFLLSSTLLYFFICTLSLEFVYLADYREHSINELANDSSAAILQMVPVVYRKFLTLKPRNQTIASKANGTIEGQISQNHPTQSSNVIEMLRNIARYNELQSILNEDLFGPLQNDSVIIVVQVTKINTKQTLLSKC